MVLCDSITVCCLNTIVVVCKNDDAHKATESKGTRDIATVVPMEELRIQYHDYLVKSQIFNIGAASCITIALTLRILENFDSCTI